MITFRKIEAQEKWLIAEWIEDDPDHKALGMTADFFFGRLFSFAVCDEEGVVGFVALEPRPPDMVVHVQFGVSERRTALAFLGAFQTVREQCAKCGAKAMVFETRNPALAAFCQRTFGFERVEGTNDWKLGLREPLAGAAE